MSRPSVSIPNLPPNFFVTISVTLSLLLTLPQATLSVPLPHNTGIHGTGGHGSNINSQPSNNKPLTPGQITGIVIGTVFLTIVLAMFAAAAINLNWCRRLAHRVQRCCTRGRSGEDGEWDRETRVEKEDADVNVVKKKEELDGVTSDSASEITYCEEMARGVVSGEETGKEEKS